ncbi:MAG: hypothetical protein ACEQSR_08590 [Candidatus Methylacidiphilales bacterium]
MSKVTANFTRGFYAVKKNIDFLQENLYYQTKVGSIKLVKENLAKLFEELKKYKN